MARDLIQYMEQLILALVLGRARTILIPPTPETTDEHRVFGPLTQNVQEIMDRGDMVVFSN